MKSGESQCTSTGMYKVLCLSYWLRIYFSEFGNNSNDVFAQVVLSLFICGIIEGTQKRNLQRTIKEPNRVEIVLYVCPLRLIKGMSLHIC